jgi:hypothetical protein
MFPELSRLRQILPLNIGRRPPAEIDDLTHFYRRTPADQHRAASLGADDTYPIDLAPSRDSAIASRAAIRNPSALSPALHAAAWPEEKLGPLGARLTLRKRA